MISNEESILDKNCIEHSGVESFQLMPSKLIHWLTWHDQIKCQCACLMINIMQLTNWKSKNNKKKVPRSFDKETDIKWKTVQIWSMSIISLECKSMKRVSEPNTTVTDQPANRSIHDDDGNKLINIYYCTTYIRSDYRSLVNIPKHIKLPILYVLQCWPDLTAICHRGRQSISK